jgi:hypothetical protein
MLAAESLALSAVLLAWRVGELVNPAVRRKILSMESFLNSDSETGGAIDGLARLERNKRFELAPSYKKTPSFVDACEYVTDC